MELVGCRNRDLMETEHLSSSIFKLKNADINPQSCIVWITLEAPFLTRTACHADRKQTVGFVDLCGFCFM